MSGDLSQRGDWRRMAHPGAAWRRPEWEINWGRPRGFEISPRPGPNWLGGFLVLESVAPLASGLGKGCRPGPRADDVQSVKLAHLLAHGRAEPL